MCGKSISIWAASSINSSTLDSSRDCCTTSWVVLTLFQKCSTVGNNDWGHTSNGGWDNETSAMLPFTNANMSCCLLLGGALAHSHLSRCQLHHQASLADRGTTGRKNYVKHLAMTMAFFDDYFSWDFDTNPKTVESWWILQMNIKFLKDSPPSLGKKENDWGTRMLLSPSVLRDR